MISRRIWIAGAVGAVGESLLKANEPEKLQGKFGLVTASLTRHFSERSAHGKITLLEFPEFLQNDLGLEVIDFNTLNFPTFDPSYLESLRKAIDRSGCLATNLKMNQRVDMGSGDKEVRSHAMEVYKESIDAAVLLGLRWVRPLPRSEVASQQAYLDSFNELIDYAGERGIEVLVENYGWMEDDPDSVAKLVDSIGASRVGVGLDTGNWKNNEIRYRALEKTFPLAVTCDFKAKAFTSEFDHPAYDLKRCFEIGIAAGYKGPWIFEHGHASLPRAIKEIQWMCEQVTEWVRHLG